MQGRRPPCEVVNWNKKDGRRRRSTAVDLLVRSWIEIDYIITEVSIVRVDLLVRSWIEIQNAWYSLATGIGRPPCEVVNWNKYVFETSLNVGKSTSLWGRELKFPLPDNSHTKRIRRPPCEVVNWNTDPPELESESIVDLLVRSWIEIHFALQDNTFLDQVDLLVRSWIEIFKMRGNSYE